MAARPRRARRWELLLGIVTAVLTIAGIWANGSIVAQQSELVGASRYNTTFDAGQLQAMLLRLEADLAASMLPATGLGTDDLAMRIDLLRNQLTVTRHGDLRFVIGRDPDAAAALAEIDTAVDRLASSLPQLRDTAVALDHLNRLRRLNPAVAHLVSLVDEESGDLVHRYQVHLSDTYEGMFALLVGLVASGLMLVAMLVWRAIDATRLARTDALTGLPNRRAFFEDLAAIEYPPGGTTHALVMLDLDGFRALSDRLGLEMSDQLLRAVAQRFAKGLPKGARIARLGADEFGIALHGPDAGSLLPEMIARFDADAGRAIDIGPLSLRVSSSMGIAVEAGTRPLDLLRYAELALDDARSNGSGLHRYFSTGLAETHRRRKAIEADLQVALDLEQLEVWFQPIVDLKDRTVISCEALLRWHHPRRGLIPPAEFIPVAEGSGLIEQLGAWVLNEACRQAASWPAPIAVAVNLSARQMRTDHALTVIRGALAASGLPASRLELEVTESVLIHDTAAAGALLDGLRALGARAALDDFGTGYASLSYLNRFQFDKIKIDRTFLRQLGELPQSSAIVEAIVRMAHGLQVVTTAEGIETEEQLARVIAIGCDQGQGYLFARPLPAHDFLRFLSVARVAGMPEMADEKAADRAA